MRIAIWDVDWFYNKNNIPNVKCMKLSSYHKQKGDEVSFITENFDIGYKYDRLYVVKDDEKGGQPPPYIMTHPKTIVIGRGVLYYRTKKIPRVIMACKPDYQLYPKVANDGRGNSYERAEFVTFFADGKRLDVRQDFRNANKRKRLVVADEELWYMDPFEVAKCLKELKKERSVVFLHPISLKVLLTNEELRLLFLQQHYAPGTLFKWQNDYGSSISDAKKILDFMLLLKTKTKSRLGFIPFNSAENSQQENPEAWQDDLMRCLQIAYMYKTHRVYFHFTPFNPSFIHSSKELMYQLLNRWRYYHDLSFIELCTHQESLRSGASWSSILKNHKKWRCSKVRFLVGLLNQEKWQEELELFALQWGDNVVNTSSIEFEIFEKYCSLL